MVTYTTRKFICPVCHTIFVARAELEDNYITVKCPLCNEEWTVEVQ